MSDFLWTTAELSAAMGARHFGNLPEAVTGISIDTRTLGAGDAFFAIKGDRFDGHDFVTQAMKAGASLAVVAEGRLVAMGRTTMPFLVVKDVLEALRAVARAARQRSRAKIVAVTGSVGKTTSKEMLRMSFAPAGKVHASAASFNNHWGVPLTLARLATDARFGVFEIGMNHAGEITPLVGMVQPDVAIITTIAPAHLGSFDSVAGIARAKAEIFSGVVEGGAAILYSDNEYFGLLHELARESGIERILTFGTGEECDFRLLSSIPDATGTDVSASIGGKEIRYRIGAAGSHLVANSLAVLGAVSLCGVDPAAASQVLAHFSAGKGRGERHRLPTPEGAIVIIDESYNANPASMKAALEVLAGTPPQEGGRRIAVLGDMLELGETSPQLHAALDEPVAASRADLVYLVGPEMSALAQCMPMGKLGGHFADADSLWRTLGPAIRGGDVIMLKASNGLKFQSIVEKLMASFASDSTKSR